ncbi:MAG: hypothetical protein AAGB29_09990 [Planctomycetota bacterium]
METWLAWLGEAGGWRAGLFVLLWRWAEMAATAWVLSRWRRVARHEQRVRPRPLVALTLPVVGLIWWFPIGRAASDYLAVGRRRGRARRLALTYGLIGLATAVPVVRWVAWPAGAAVLGWWLATVRPRGGR